MRFRYKEKTGIILILEIIIDVKSTIAGTVDGPGKTRHLQIFEVWRLS
jgi:hypothetical protein